jgi:sodium transport system permease protein
MPAAGSTVTTAVATPADVQGEREVRGTMPRDVMNIWRKEIMDTVRDRKGMTQAIVIPLVIGIFYASFTPMLMKAMTARREKPLTIPARGIEYADARLLDTFGKYGITLEEYEGDLEAVIQDAKKESGLVFEPGFTEEVAEERPATARLLTNSTAGGIFGGGFSDTRLQLAVSAYNQMVVADRMAARQVDPSILVPVALNTEDLATPEQRGAFMASFYLTILVAVTVAQGGLFVAIDVTAGEKERGTLESLLVTPASDMSVFLGKLGAVFTISVIPLVLTLTAFWAVSNLMPPGMAGDSGLPGFMLTASLITGLPLALIVSVAQMMISVRARTFRDAQSGATPLIFAVMIPGFVAAFSQAKALWSCLLPVYGPFAAMNRMAQAGGLQWDAMALSVVGSLIAAAVVSPVAIKMFTRETLLYRS